MQLDDIIRCDTVERLDRDDIPSDRKVGIVQELHRLNRRLFSYHRFYGAIHRVVRDVWRKERRPARVLELAAGSGEFTFACARIAKRLRTPVEVTGSDVVPAYVEAGQRAARGSDLPVSFRLLNAFDMGNIERGAYDVAFIAQSLHHFSAGQVAMMIAQSSRVCSRAFVGVDGHRSLLLLGTVPVYAAMTLHRDFLHDATISMRKFYSEPELELMARLAAPHARIRTRSARPGFSVLEVRFDS